MVYEIHKNQLGKPYLKKVDRSHQRSIDGRGTWVAIGRVTDHGIEKVVRINQQNNLLVLLDDEGVFRALVLVD